MSNWNFVIAAYAVTWITIALYAVSLLKRNRALTEELQESEP